MDQQFKIEVYVLKKEKKGKKPGQDWRLHCNLSLSLFVKRLLTDSSLSELCRARCQNDSLPSATAASAASGYF